jgi:transglutaminase-like putative cysteine protease
MRYNIEHTTEYQYSSPVFLEPHIFRLQPTSNGIQRLERFEMQVSPLPAGSAITVDGEGNSELRCWFEGMTTSLKITTSAEVSVLRSDPFAYLPIGEDELPYVYPTDSSTAIEPYRAGGGTEEVRRLAERVAHQTAYSAQAFLPALTMAIHEQCMQEFRADGPPFTADHTLFRRSGSCRDLAVVFMEACRHMGFAARFVSGYYVGLPSENGNLHAWAEVYVEGGGWRGFDPTAGLAVADEHVAVAAAIQPRNAAPAVGTYRGDASVELTTRIRIKPLVISGAHPQTQLFS